VVERITLKEPRKEDLIFTHLRIKCRRFARIDALLKVNGASSSANVQVTVQAISVDTSVLINPDDNFNYLLITQNKPIDLKFIVCPPCMLTYFLLLTKGSHVMSSSCHLVQHQMSS
jgi:hypothetical protein